MRLLRPSLIVFCLALLASLCIHLPIYEVLGALAKHLLASAPKPAPPSQIEFEVGPPTKSTPATPSAATLPKPKSERAEQAQKQPAKARPEPAHPTEVVKAVPVQRPPDRQAAERPLAVTQKSEDPNVPAPDHARFVADENRRVEQESVARVRDLHRDDSEPQVSTQHPQPNQNPGNADDTEAADLRDLKGSRERTPNAREAQQEPERASQPSAGKREAPAVPMPASEATPSPPAQARQEPSGPPPSTQPDTITVQDETGSFTIRKQPTGPATSGASERPSSGPPATAQAERAGQNARDGVKLNLSWSQFEQAFGSEELAQQRQAYLEQRRSRAAGNGGERQRMWKEFRAAIENYVPDVQPGTQTALNAAADPFAQYLAVVHRRIHREFAQGFLRSLPIAGGPFGDPSLHTELEIVINGDGNIHRVGIAQSSGFLPFDYGAFNAVMRSAPYGTPPRKILSGDGRVYVHWGFYRNERQCGTFNARPYILPHPPGSPKAPGPLRDDEGRPAPSVPAVSPDEGELGLRD